MKPLVERIYDEIEQVLLHHRLSRWQCDDGESNYPLTDMLTPDGESIQAGYDEIRNICDSIYNEVLTTTLAKAMAALVEVESMDVMRAEFEKWHNEHFIDKIVRSSGGSDYRDSNVVRRWEAWQGARKNRPVIPEKVEKTTGCIAPGCHFWDGNPECTCKREKLLHYSD